jgi:hypothetical protein
VALLTWLLFFGQAMGQQDQSITFSTYFGGTDHDQIRDVAVDSQGAVIAVGGSRSADFPARPNASGYLYDGTPNGSFDVFVVKFASDGSLLWSTLIGGTAYERAYAVDVDSQDNIYVAGRAGAGFPVTAGAAQTLFQGGRADPNDPYGTQDGFVCKLDRDGVLVFCSYFGSTDGSIVRDVAVDASGSIYLAAGNDSGTYSAGVASAFLNGPLGDEDAVLARIASDGSAVLWARYLGGTAWDSNENSVQVDAAGNPFLLFTTESSGLATAGAYDTTYAGGKDVFVIKSDAAGNVLWGTYLGGPQIESTETHELAVTGAGNVYVATPTQSSFDSIPGSPGTMRRTYGVGGGGNDVIVARLSTSGSLLEALTFIGGSSADRPEGVATDVAGNVYITGVTHSADFPLTSNALLRTGSAAGAAMVVKLDSNLERLYASFHGGSGEDQGRAAAVGSAGRFYLAGMTKSDDLDVTDAAQAVRSGNWDGFVVSHTPIVPGTCLVDCRLCDASGDDLMNGVELAWVGRAFGLCSTNPSGEWWHPVDYDASACVDGIDLAVLSGLGVWGQSTATCAPQGP